MTNLYDILQVSQNCTPEELKKAYKKLAILHHPDKGGDAVKFKEINNAYSILSDPEKRSKYDRYGDAEAEPNIFEQMFGFGSCPEPREKKRRTIIHTIQITNKEAYYGEIKNLKIVLNKKCMTCVAMCQVCQGQGQINELHRMGPFTTMSSRPCNQCGGSGQCVRGNIRCNTCYGKGEYQEEKKIEINIPSGVDSGKQIFIEGCGEQPHSQNEIAGDLIIEIKVIPDPIFERKGLDLIYKQTITFRDALLGKTLNIPLYNGLHTMDIAEFGVIEPNKDYIINGKGMKGGNLILRFIVKYPRKEISSECKKEFEEIFRKYETELISSK
jgi:DnaJ-class molecular chaperone